ncbi:MAG: family 10 glycosylhydrolase [Oscillospiraceae bacterium]
MKKATKFVIAATLALIMTACSKAEYKTTSGTIDIMPQISTSSNSTFETENPKVDETVILDSEEKTDDELSKDNSVLQTNTDTSSKVETSSSSSSKVESSTASSSKTENLSSSSEAASKKPVSSSHSEVASQPVKSSSSTDEEQNADNTVMNSVVSNGEMRAVWISYLDFNTLLKGKSEGEFRTNIKKAFSNITDLGMNTVIVQVRPFSDALYYSDIFPISHIVTGTEGVDPGFDPLKIMVDYAHSYGLEIEAWINPYRVRNSGTKAELSSENPAKKWLDSGDLAVVSHKAGISYNPASDKAIQLIVDGVAEIVQNYDVDGIHFDDYFYPTTEQSFDSQTYAKYQSNGGSLSLANYRRENVNKLVRAVYSKIKSINPNVKFGISPQGNLENNFDQQYIDVDKWLSNQGYVDYICPQIYFGFENTKYPFAYTVKLWNDKIKVQGIELYIGMAPYKIGTEDKWAGEGKNEWIQSSNTLQRMVLESRKYSKCEGFFMYRYDSLINPIQSVKNQVNTEIENLNKVL